LQHGAGCSEAPEPIGHYRDQNEDQRRALWSYLVTAFGLAVLWANQADAQPPIAFEFGLRAGIPFHNIVESRLITFTAQSTVHNSERPWIAVGPTFGVMLYDQVQIELGAIYKPVRFQTDTLACANSDCSQRVPGITIHESMGGHLWEFMLTANYHFGRNPIRPYAGGGIVVGQAFGGKCNARTTDQVTGKEIVDPLGLGHVCFPALGLLQHEPSVVMDVGLRWSHSRLKIQPELRYTRHRPEAQPDPRTRGTTAGGVVPRADQFDFLVGFFFAGKER
jgi:hypothetical protein